MKIRYMIALAVVVLMMPTVAHAQARQVICLPGTNANTGNSTCSDVTPSNPLPTTGALPSGAATSANQPTNSAQGATTSGQTGNVEMRATLTGAAAYVNGTTNPAITDTLGSDPVTLRDSSGVAVNLATPSGTYQTLPSGATQVSVSSGNVAASVATASMPAVVGQTNYVSGFIVTAGGATVGADVTVTLAGIAGGTMSFTFTFPLGAAVPAAPLIVQFQTPLAASAANTTITLSVPSGGNGNTNCTANIWGRVQ